MHVQHLGPGEPSRVDRFVLEGRIADGGMSRVYLGRDPEGDPVAVKLVRPVTVGDDEFRARFRREVEALDRISGLCTPRLIAADTEAPRPWLATEYIAGPSLLQAVRNPAPPGPSPLPEPSVRVLAKGLVRALNGVHAAGIVHRDLTPGNVLLAADGPCLIDFGTATTADVLASLRPEPRARQERRRAEGRRQGRWRQDLWRGTGPADEARPTETIATVGFMSPELATGRTVGPESDVFSLGTVLAFAATGKNPFGTGSDREVMDRIVRQPPDLSGLSDELRSIVARCLEKDPAARPPTREILDCLAYLDHVDGAEAAEVPWPLRVQDMIYAREVPALPDVPRAEREGTRLYEAPPSASQPTEPVPPPPGAFRGGRPRRIAFFPWPALALSVAIVAAVVGLVVASSRGSPRPAAATSSPPPTYRASLDGAYQVDTGDGTSTPIPQGYLLTAGQTVRIVVTIKNTGTATWHSSGPEAVALLVHGSGTVAVQSADPSGATPLVPASAVPGTSASMGSTAVGPTGTGAPDRVALAQVVVPPDTTGTFDLALVAPLDSDLDVGLTLVVGNTAVSGVSLPSVHLPAGPVVGVAAAPGGGYWLATAHGDVVPEHGAPMLASAGGHATSASPTVGIAATPDGRGCWLATAKGAVLAFGDAATYPALTGQAAPSSPVVGIAATSDGLGYWLATQDGSVLAYGDATPYGSDAGQTLQQPVVGIVPAQDGKGYWLVAGDGGVFAFKDAAFDGSEAGQTLQQPVVGMARTPDGGGYYLLAADGGVFTFGDATFMGAVTSTLAPGATAVGIIVDPSGYLVVDNEGHAYQQ